MASPYSPQDAPVREEEQANGKEEAHREPVIIDGPLPWLNGIMLKADPVLVLILHNFIMHEEMDTSQKLLDPDHHADPGSSLHGAELVEAERMGHCQVPINGNAAEKAHTDINVLIEENATDLTGQVSMGPVVMLQNILEPEGQGTDIEEVSHSQVAEVDPQFVLGFDLQVAIVEREAIGWKTHHQNQNVYHRSQSLVNGMVDGTVARGRAHCDVPHLLDQ